MRGIFGIILFVTTIGYTVAQNGIFLPEDFLLYRYRLSAVNPAFSDSSRYYGVSGYRQYAAPLGKVNTFYFLAGMRFGKSENYHYTSLSATNYKEGPYISRPSFHLIHSYRLNLSRGYILTAGLSAGFAGYYFNSPAATGNARFTVFDLNAGLRLSHKGFSAGAAILQIPDQNVQPRLGTYKYPRFFNFDYSISRPVSLDFTISQNTLFKMVPGFRNSINAAADIKWKDLLSGGLGYRSVTGVFFYVEIDTHVTESGILTLNAAYNSALASKNLLGVNLYEFTLKIRRQND